MENGAGPAIIVVETDPRLSYLMQWYVRTSGCRPVTTYEGREALRLARQERPAAILLEADLPEMSGWDVLQALRAEESTRDVPVLVVSWLDERARCLEEGANGCLRRPVLYDDFVAALADAGLAIGCRYPASGVE